MIKESEIRTALFISGGGSTAEAVIKAHQSGELRGILPIVVISSRSDAPGIQKAESLGVQTRIVQRKDFSSPESFGEQLLRTLKSYGVELVSQNGWLPLTPTSVVQEYRERIINQHPGPLDPGRGNDFGGKGMYGSRVTAARLGYSWIGGEDFWTEATTHHVTEKYDDGDLIRIVQMDIPPLGRLVTIAELQNFPQPLIDKTKEVQAKLLPLEHRNVIATLQMFAEQGSLPHSRRPKPLIPEGREQILLEAKRLAIELFPNG
ncbi:MAG: hypothetical protein A3C27_01870 [Candidatus Levybacteria bacterium RIFCSPHIGHO2_02_FULL_39_36]|nr:MAG: hypothetical protein A3C27_01870 [Candidatus Levybacteria bacterium RIFCSPHIGHO2_02_FULL_39_36]OGH45425.1 MAG: hypothetical protein A3H82_02365 [Candidatus Levybacteria bacterium RIFCSPLOWO2_02_FULL_39_26]